MWRPAAEMLPAAAFWSGLWAAASWEGVQQLAQALAVEGTWISTACKCVCSPPQQGSLH